MNVSKVYSYSSMVYTSEFDIGFLYNAEEEDGFDFERYSENELSRIGLFALNTFRLCAYHQHLRGVIPETIGFIVTYSQGTFALHIEELSDDFDRPVPEHICRFDRELAFRVSYAAEAGAVVPASPREDLASSSHVGERFLRGLEAFDCLRHRTPDHEDHACVFEVVENAGGIAVFNWKVPRKGEFSRWAPIRKLGGAE